MHSLISRLREPVRREGAERYLLITLLSFAASVMLTRLFLQVSGYPQVGGKTLHIAHVLWGGLLLFVAALLPLLFANRSVYGVSALLSGVGVGLFIDEVGKFITQTNDYFYPAAAPIIYALFLLVTLLYWRLHRPARRSDRADLYQALDGLAEVIDHDLEQHELLDLKRRLRAVAQEQRGDPDLARLAQALLDYLDSPSLHVVPNGTVPGAPLWLRIQSAWERRITRPVLRISLLVGLVIVGLPGAIGLVEFAMHFVGVGAPAGTGADAATVMQVAVEALTDVPLLVAAGLIAAGRERRGIAVAFVSLLVSLTALNLVDFYFDQFRAAVEALLQFVLLQGVLSYRRRYLAPPVRATAAAAA